MVIVGTSAETAPTVPKDNATVDRRIDAVIGKIAVSLPRVDRIAPAVPVGVQVSGAIATIAVTTGPTIAVEARVAKSAVDTGVATTDATTAASAGPMNGAPSRDAATIVDPVAVHVVVVGKVASGRHAVARQSVSSVVTRVPTSRTSRTRWKRRSSIRPCAAIC
ncbi:hypothetical protein A6I89_13900 [Prescottella equi]|uniref:Uncharacterized protein n=1 Tax=Rhodococcus hoagii TaxID=43767 RepID=A0AAE5IQW3_RHOHA|nr:hypothetical protein H849_12693 [Prescottella equi NBRC 101255 = C 7]ORL27095.1 hypothetical protein A6I89_13900 [Prescottella equi]ORM00447.1 hypothetical protein A5N73_15750 [Prescottella equi]ORM27015.1 hypothetical protein A5N68_10945 [Prescottella equi]SUE02392.1 Uncharacterised protein [Prescottella equi]